MKIVHRVARSCDCRTKLKYLEQEESYGDGLEVGSIVECECGKLYKLIDDRRDGAIWQWYNPDSGNMALR